jgi:uncharacterized membrane protein YgcG
MDSSAVMSLNANQRRDQRRRLVLSWKRTANPGEAVPAESPRAMAAYDPEAIPENQRGPATLLPTGLGGLTLAILSIVLPLVATLVVASSGQLFGRDLFAGGGRFARTLAAAAAVFDSRGVASLQVWRAQTFLMAAASVALIVRLLRRHRRDDYKGRFRAWGWMAALLLLTACAGVAPLMQRRSQPRSQPFATRPSASARPQSQRSTHSPCWPTPTACGAPAQSGAAPIGVASSVVPSQSSSRLLQRSSIRGPTSGSASSQSPAHTRTPSPSLSVSTAPGRSHGASAASGMGAASGGGPASGGGAASAGGTASCN